MQQHVAVRVSNGMGKSFPQLKKIMACLLPNSRRLGMAPNSRLETTARFIWNAKVSSNYYFFSAAAILTLTTLILVLPQNTLELTKITKISTAYAEISIPYKSSLWCGCCQKVCWPCLPISEKHLISGSWPFPPYHSHSLLSLVTKTKYMQQGRSTNLQNILFPA